MSNTNGHSNESEPLKLAEEVLHEVADSAEHIGDFVKSIELGDNVYDYRFVSLLPGYEGWQWSVTLYHDIELDSWTVNESSLTPTDESLLAPDWIPWKDRILASDLSPTDSIGTDPDDERIEQGVSAQDLSSDESDKSGGFNESDDESDGVSSTATSSVATSKTSREDLEEAIDRFELGRTHVLSAKGRAETAERWYNGPHGPKSLSTRTAGGRTCEECGFFIPLQGELGKMFGVCANKWSQDDGKVVSRDHGCGEHSEILPADPTPMWIQPEPTINDGYDFEIKVVKQSRPEEMGEVELLEDAENSEIERDSGTIEESEEN